MPDAGSTPRRTLADALSGAVLFGALGPPIGALPFAVFFAVTDRADSSVEERSAGIRLVGSVACILGGVPAVVSGLLIGRRCARLGSWTHSVGGGALCALLAPG